MTLENLKTLILNKEGNKINLPIIFKCDENTDFILKDYIKEIATLKDLNIKIIFGLDEITEQLFNNNLLYVLKSDSVDTNTILNKNIVVISKKIKEKSNLIIEVPQLASWQIADYIKTRIPTLSEEAVNCLSNYTNLYKLDLELQKLELFSGSECDTIFNDLININNYEDLITTTNYEFASMIIKKDLGSLKTALRAKKEIEPFSLVNILIKNFRQMIEVTFNQHSTPESLNINQKVFNAIKFNAKRYSSQELITDYKFLLNLDFLVKSGNLLTNNLLDYVVSNLI